MSWAIAFLVFGSILLSVASLFGMSSRFSRSGEMELHWRKLFAELRKSKQSLALLDACDKLNLPRGSKAVEEAADNLVKFGRARMFLGKALDGTPCRCLIEQFPSRSTRDDLYNPTEEKTSIDIESGRVRDE